jgi:hypothetical protein
LTDIQLTEDITGKLGSLIGRYCITGEPEIFKKICELENIIESNQKIVQNIRDEVGSLDLALDSFDEDTEAYKQLNELKLKYQKLLGSDKK